MKRQQRPQGLSYTRQLRQQREEAAFWQRCGYPNPADVPEAFDLVDLRQRGDTPITDRDLAFLVGRVRSIDTLDLKEAEISNAGIQCLTGLESIQSLYLKGCAGLDNGAVPWLNQLSSLRSLNLDGTGVDMQGLLQLTGLTLLTELAFYAPASEQLEAQLEQLAAQHPGCRIMRSR